MKFSFIKKVINTKLIHLDSKILVPESEYLEVINKKFRDWIEENKFNYKGIVVASSENIYRESGVFCSFCGEKNTDENLIVYSEQASICKKCINLCNEIINENRDKDDWDIKEIPTEKAFDD